MDKWNARVKKWQDWTGQGRSVEFRYWGNYEIWERLSREEHRGRYYFWFNREFFSKQWFQERLDEAVINAGARYTPALNVELPIARLFDGLGRTIAFFKWLEAQGPSVLLVRKDTFSRFLRENDLALIWTVRGEKQFVGDPLHSRNFIGRLHVTGAYGMAADGHLEGGIHPKFSALDAAKTSS